MDKQTYEQLDRIEMKIDLIIKKGYPELLDKDNKLKEL